MVSALSENAGYDGPADKIVRDYWGTRSDLSRRAPGTFGDTCNDGLRQESPNLLKCGYSRQQEYNRDGTGGAAPGQMTHVIHIPLRPGTVSGQRFSVDWEKKLT